MNGDKGPPGVTSVGVTKAGDTSAGDIIGLGILALALNREAIGWGSIGEGGGASRMPGLGSGISELMLATAVSIVHMLTGLELVSSSGFAPNSSRTMSISSFHVWSERRPSLFNFNL